MFLLDTNVVSELNRPRPALEVTTWIQSVSQRDLFLSVISIAEIVRGITRHPDPIRKQALQHWLDSFVRPWLHQRILPLSEAVAEITGQLSGQQESSGKPISLADAAIAATAIQYGYTLVTRNVKYFSGLPLDILNPWTDTVPRKA